MQRQRDHSLGERVYFASAAPISILRRVAIVLVDSAVLAVLVGVTLACIIVLEDMVAPGYLIVSFLLLAWAYVTILKTSQTRTLGYRMTRSKIVDLQGNRPSLLRMTFRLLHWMAGPFSFFMDLLWAGIDDDRQTLRDRFAGTFVVDDSAEPIGRGPIHLTRYTGFGFLLMASPLSLSWPMNVRILVAWFASPIFLALSLASSVPARGDDNWPQFRGHGGLGIGSGSPPTKWDTKTGTNIAWKASIPGLGHSAPIVWGDRVFVTTAVNADAKKPEVKTGWSGGAGESAKDTGKWAWQIACLDLLTGKARWSRTAHVGEPTIRRHLKASHANCTPATDGEFVVAFFGSEGLYCFDFDGRLIWKRDFGKLHSGPYDAPELQWGFASSPIIHDGKVIVQCDCLNTNFVAVLDLKTGREIRRIDREGEVATWSTPLVVTTKNGSQIVCNGYRQMAGYDLASGKRLWNLADGGDVPVPTPLFANGLIYITNGHGRSPTYAIRPTAVGDLTPTGENPKHPGLSWWQARGGTYMPTPLVHEKLHYACNDNGRLVVRDAMTGELIYRKRIGKGGDTYSASAVTSGGHLYFASERGRVTVIRAGREFKRVASNEMDAIIMATPAIASGRLLIRTAQSLFCIAPRPSH